MLRRQGVCTITPSPESTKGVPTAPNTASILPGPSHRTAWGEMALGAAALRLPRFHVIFNFPSNMHRWATCLPFLQTSPLLLAAQLFRRQKSIGSSPGSIALGLSNRLIAIMADLDPNSPVLSPPAGVESNLENPPNGNALVVGLTSFLFAISLSSILIRAFSKMAYMKNQPGLGDCELIPHIARIRCGDFTDIVHADMILPAIVSVTAK